MKPLFDFAKKPTGRPPLVELTADDIEQIRSLYLATNRNKKEGSIQLAWVRFCEANPERFAHLVANHMPLTSIPVAAREACRKRKALVGPARGGAARQRHEGAYVPGTMRRHHDEDRRLRAGERASVDDATRNVACWIPWPWGGCPCSDKFGVKLGRWQTLVVHDDASEFVPFVSSVFRWAQSYRATDAASVIYRAEQQVLQFDQWAIEGGVWQAKRTLDVLGGRFLSAKGRPNQKLVENYFGRLWTIMAGQKGDVGRHRGEIKRNSDLYVQARGGKVDPRLHFMSLTEAQQALYSAMDYLAEKRIDSRIYGSWIPKERWESDLAEFPRPARANADDFLILPVAKDHVVRSGSVSTREDGPLGVPMQWVFTADWLWEYEGRKVRIYFDPMSEWPVTGHITLQDSRKLIGTVTCISPQAMSKDSAIEIVKSVRQTMMTETRVLSTKHTERTVRHAQGVITSSTSDTVSTADTVTDRPADPVITLDRVPLKSSSREVLAPSSRDIRDDLANSLSRRAARAREGSILI